MAALFTLAAATMALPPFSASANPFTQTGIASWYGNNFKGRKMADGHRYDPGDFTAAHRTLPLGTMLRVTALRTGLSIVVRVNNRGPFIKGRIIDLSTAAARKLDMMRSGIARVRIEVVPPDSNAPKSGG